MVYKNEMFVTELADGYSDEILNEVKDVYAKAKAWDNYVSEVRERVKITVNTEDGIEKETQEIIDYYMEGK